MNNDRLLNEFYKLISFDSPSYYEDDIASYLFNKLKSLNLYVEMDNAIEKLTGRKTKTGNIYGFLKGNIEGDSILLSSHMDTVLPANNKKAIIDNGIIKSAGNSVLGADDVTGIAEIIELLTVIKENNLKHPDIEVLFFVAEEQFCKGSSVFDFKKVKSKIAYVLDLSGKVGTIAIAAPSIYSFEIKIKGKPAHAGFEPEKGISSILISALAISKTKLGRIDDDTTINIGTIKGGNGKNIIPEETILTGEVRSLDDKKAISLLNELEKTFKEEAKSFNAEIEFNYEQNILAYKIDENELVIKKYKEALNNLGYSDPKLISTFGGSDNNNFNKNNIKGIVIANAMNNIHTKEEYFEIDEFIKATKILIKLVTKGE